MLLIIVLLILLIYVSIYILCANYVNESIDIKTVAKVINHDGFCEVIAIKDIPKNTYLIDSMHKDIINRPFNTYMNDNDFTYPENFTKEELTKCFEKYNNANNNNCYRYDDKLIITTKYIKKGQSLTKRYEVLKWLLFLHADINRINPFVSDNRIDSMYYVYHKITPDEIATANNNLKAVANDMGYNIITTDKDKTKKQVITNTKIESGMFGVTIEKISNI